jgi:acetoin utilization deacetylase AcuC-like enzyme
MTLLYSDPRFLDHKTGAHPERPERLQAIASCLAQAGLDRECRRPQWGPVSQERLARVHSPAYIDQVRTLAAAGGGELDPDTVASPASFGVALHALGAVCDATERVVRGEDSTALCLVRPPGHHALYRRAMGFCLFNNVAVAAHVAIKELGLDRVLIVDWDIHHGNGTQATFWRDPQVGFLSIHRWPFYPGTGLNDETGEGPGLGTTRNLPVPFGIPRKDYRTLFGDAAAEFAARLKPQLVLLSAGFDAHCRDPIGNLGLETEDFATLTSHLLDIVENYAGGRLISVLEGGYDWEATAESVKVHLEAMLRRQEPRMNDEG